MALSPGAKVGLVAAVGIGAFLLAGGSSSAAAAAPIDPCNKTPPDCASLTACVTKLLPIATKTDIPDLQKVSAVAKSLGCADLVKQLDAKIAELSKKDSGTTTGDGGTVVPGSVFVVSNIKDRKLLVNKAWTLARMGITGPGLAPASPEDVAKYHIESNGSFHDVSDALHYASDGKTAIVDVKTGEIITRSPFTIVNELQAAAGLIVDGKFGPESRKAWSWGLANGTPSSIGGESILRHNHRTTVGSESVAGCSACDAGGASIGNPESLGPYNTVPNYDGAVKFDRAFGSNFGAGPANGPLARKRIFGHNARWGV